MCVCVNLFVPNDSLNVCVCVCEKKLDDTYYVCVCVCQMIFKMCVLGIRISVYGRRYIPGKCLYKPDELYYAYLYV